MSRKQAIGIDLGTSKCCVGVVRDGKVEILENERGNKTTPSYVAFTDTERLVGEDAKDQATLNPANTVFGIKRIIGREMTDVLLKEARGKMPYTIMNESEEETRIRVSYKKIEELLLPQQITAMLLGKMKNLAQHHLKSEVEDAVISVPASFSNAQRQATKDAAAIAGLKVLALINEPTAAAIAYQVNRRKTDEENIAVVDFGAGKLDVAIVTVRRGCVSVRAVSGNPAIGGDDIDRILMEHVGKKFDDKHGRKLPESLATTERLRACCEKLKRKLTLLPNVQETLECFGDDVFLPLNMKRDHFNSMIPSEIQLALQLALTHCLDGAMQAARLPLEKISCVVLVGGSSRIPLFQTWLKDFFGPNLLDKSVNPDEAVAYGATLYAALLNSDNELEELTLNDTVPNSYCFSCEGDSSTQTVFDRYFIKTLPQQRMYAFKGLSPFNANTRRQKFEFYEEVFGQKNSHRLIGTLCLDEEFRQAVPLINNVTFEIDRCGIFNAVVHLNPHHAFPNVLKNYAGKLSENELLKVIDRERQFRQDDQNERERVEAMSRLEAFSCRLRKAMNDSKAKELFPEIVERISNKVNETIEWLDFSNTVPIAQYDERLIKLENLEKDLKSKWKQYQKEESDRLAAVTNLESFCLFLRTSLGTCKADETELVAALGKLLEEASDWLKSSERPSKQDCDDRKDSMKKVHVEIERRLEIKRQEDERQAAVDNLHKCCSKLQDMKFEGDEFEFIRYNVRRLTEENERCMRYLDVMELPSKAECDSRRQRLEKMVCEVETKVERERARKLESERQAAITHLRSRCTALEALSLSIPQSDAECNPIAVLGTQTLMETRRWLNESKAVTTELCLVQLGIIENYLTTLTDLKERDRLACLDYCKSRFAYVNQTCLIELSWKKEEELCNKVIQKKNELISVLKTGKFLRRDYDRKLATFETAVGTLRNKMKMKHLKEFEK